MTGILSINWLKSVTNTEATFHQLAPYIGRMKSSMASQIIRTFTHPADIIYEPFCGAGTAALEAWIAGRHVIANDLNPYAYVLTKGKLFPYPTVDEALDDIERLHGIVQTVSNGVDLTVVPTWVRRFFHPRTLREAIAWSKVLRQHRSNFLLSCLLGILHHQRPGFLSFPSSHSVPYLRGNNFPRQYYPELYGYRAVKKRLRKKVLLAYRRPPELNPQVLRRCYRRDAATFIPPAEVTAIITSPPYMRQLDYARDNRLRLWFLGINRWEPLDSRLSLSEGAFIQLFRSCLRAWHKVLPAKGICMLVLGDAFCRSYKANLPDVAVHIATKEVGGYSLVCMHADEIPTLRRVRRSLRGSVAETVLVLRRS
ncbi:MAG TPA: DNA adenine methylase [Blastocatellia bacterium]